ncbi:hypothetical protein P5G49_07725 [Sporosarcina sp. F6_3S_P_2]|uniref:Uncharacterized protein n=2 Tax=Sporosarcina highlanderae TaxID=3035916 RepID=A0ABT8JQD1_9BACL|nr:hypothetical protein [Sporosarcina highlanderae]
MEWCWIEDERIDEQSRLMKTWLKSRVDNPYIVNMLWHFDSENVLAFRRAGSEMDSKTLYVVAEYAEERMKFLVKCIERESKIVPLVRKVEKEVIEQDEQIDDEAVRFVSTPTGIFQVKRDL